VLSLRRKADDIPRAKKFAEKAGCGYGNWTCLRFKFIIPDQLRVEVEIETTEHVRAKGSSNDC
jgi:hypothetical protein